jgi:hypothetical protein
MSKSGRFAPDFMIMQRRKEEEYRRTFEEKVKTDGSIGRVAHWEHKTANKCACPRPPAPTPVLLPPPPRCCLARSSTRALLAFRPRNADCMLLMLPGTLPCRCPSVPLRGCRPADGSKK